MASEDFDRGAVQDEKRTTQDQYSWSEVWSVIGVDGDEMLSVSQLTLAYDAYDVEKPPSKAVEENDLTRVTRTGVDVSGDRVQIHAGYRLVGNPTQPEQEVGR